MLSKRSAGQAAVDRPRIKAPRQHHIARADGFFTGSPVGNTGRTSNQHYLDACLPKNPKALFEIQVVKRVLPHHFPVGGYPEHVAPGLGDKMNHQRRETVWRVQTFTPRNLPALCLGPLYDAIHSVAPERDFP